MNNWANGFDPAVHIDKLEATIAQQQVRIEALTLEVACLSDGPTTDEWQGWLAAEQERVANLYVVRDDLYELLQAERELNQVHLIEAEQRVVAERERAEKAETRAAQFEIALMGADNGIHALQVELQAERERVAELLASRDAYMTDYHVAHDELQAEREKSARARSLALDALAQAYEEGSYGGVTLATLKQLCSALTTQAPEEK